MIVAIPRSIGNFIHRWWIEVTTHNSFKAGFPNTTCRQNDDLPTRILWNWGPSMALFLFLLTKWICLEEWCCPQWNRARGKVTMVSSWSTSNLSKVDPYILLTKIPWFTSILLRPFFATTILATRASSWVNVIDWTTLRMEDWPLLTIKLAIGGSVAFLA